MVDHDRLMNESVAAQKVRSDIEKKRQAFQAELDQQERLLRQEEEDLTKRERELTEQEFSKRRMEFTKKVSKIHEKVAERRAQLEHAIQEARTQIIDEIADIVAELCEKRGVQAVFPKAAVVYAKSNLDVTEEVLKRLNAQLSEVKINFTKQGQE
ncbi:MAG: OmpH family outer membrane protein [Alphaproteobacteria bacterium]|jgi:outer membrane protein